MNSSSEETYLEAFIEQLTTSQFSYQLHRTIDMLRDLDTTYHADLTVLRQLSDEFITNVENKIVQTLDVVEMDHDHPDMDADEPDEVSERTKKRRRPVYGVRAITTDGTASSEHPVILPTTEELMEYILRHNDTGSDDIGSNATTDKPTMDHIYKQILHLQKECLQKADEKVTISQQAYEMIDAQVQRLDTDLAAMEQLLQSTGEFQTGVQAKPNDLAACQVSPGSEWILAKVIHHDPTSGTYKLSDEDVESNKIFDLPESQVVVLNSLERLSKGDTIYAVYPDTTSFYQATVVQAPRKQGSNAMNQASMSNPNSSTITSTTQQFVMVHFVDDADEFGITHDKAVPIQHIMLPPSSI